MKTVVILILGSLLISCTMQETITMDGSCILRNKQTWNYVFSEADASSEKKDSLMNDTISEEYQIVTIRAITNNMAQIEYNADTIRTGLGWINMECLAVNPSTTERIPLYSWPDTKSKVAFYIDNPSWGDLYTVIGCKGNWLEIRHTENGVVKKGWLSPDFQCANPYSACCMFKNQNKINKMKELIKELETALIESGNPILSKMDVEASHKTDQEIINSFKDAKLECCPELLELYKWKSGCNEKNLFEIEDVEKSRALCSVGNIAAYPISTKMYKEYQQCEQYWFTDECLSPFIFNGIYEDPVLINLNPKSKDYKALFFYSPALLYPDPTKMYDSIESWMETIIQCYKKHIYHIDKDGFLITDLSAEVKLARKLNPNSEYWFDDCCSTWGVDE